jgi:hypothetical protein
MRVAHEEPDKIAYVLMDPRKPGPFYFGHFKFAFEPFYVGKGKAGRPMSHITYVHKQTRSPKTNKIKSMLRQGVTPEIRVVKKKLTEQQSFDLEVHLISKIKRIPEGPLVNLTDGGEGASGLKHSKSSIRKRVDSRKNHSKEELELRSKRQSSSRLVWEALRPAAHKKRAIKKLKETLAKKSKKSRQRKSSEAVKVFWARATPEIIAERERKRRKTLDDRPYAEKCRTKSRRNASISRTKAARTEEQRAATKAKVTALWAAYTPEQRAARCKKQGDAIRLAKSR